jgi:hypothetical protein
MFSDDGSRHSWTCKIESDHVVHDIDFLKINAQPIEASYFHVGPGGCISTQYLQDYVVDQLQGCYTYSIETSTRAWTLCSMYGTART